MPNSIQTVNLAKNSYEKAAWKANLVIAGIDEVGRGCLAGPVVTAAAILRPGSIPRYIQDSKILSEKEREQAFEWLRKNSFYGIGIVHHRFIDSQNIWQATLVAMKKALVNLLAVYPNKHAISAILVDAMPMNLSDTSYHTIPVHHFPFGEQKSSSIAAASIIAKVTRDRLMTTYDKIFPGYQLNQHKGYSTKIHKAAVITHGHTLIHRISFLNNTFEQKRKVDEKQQSFC